MHYFILFFLAAVTQITSVAAPAHRVEMLSLFSDQWWPELVIDLSGSSSDAWTVLIRGG